MCHHLLQCYFDSMILPDMPWDMFRIAILYFEIVNSKIDNHEWSLSHHRFAALNYSLRFVLVASHIAVHIGLIGLFLIYIYLAERTLYQETSYTRMRQFMSNPR